MSNINSRNVMPNDVLIKAYGKRLGLFTSDRVYIAIPFPLSIFYRTNEVELEYSKINRMSLLIANSDISIYLAYTKSNGKTGGYSIGLGNSVKNAVPYFYSAVELVKACNPQVEIHIAEPITKALAKQLAQNEAAAVAQSKRNAK